MAKPPLQPQKYKDKDMTYFELLVRLASPYLLEDSITLNFDGYNQTLIEYANLKEDDLASAWRLTKELNTWSEYFSSIANLIQKQYLDSETEKIQVQAAASIEADVTKVSNGDRLSNNNPVVIKARKKRNMMKSLYNELETKIKFLERGYYHCKSTCDWAYRTTNNNNNLSA